MLTYFLLLTYLIKIDPAARILRFISYWQLSAVISSYRQFSAVIGSFQQLSTGIGSYMQLPTVTVS